MAELTVDGLGELTSPAANDEIGIWDVSAGQYLKIRRDTLVGGTITGGGTVATGGYTLTVPGTGTAALVSRGTWVPTLTGSGGAPTISYSNRLGWYERVGNLVYISFYIETTSISGGGGDLLIASLPFLHKTSAGIASMGAITGKLNLSSSGAILTASVISGADYMYMFEQFDNSAPIALALSAWENTSFIKCSLVYLTE